MEVKEKATPTPSNGQQKKKTREKQQNRHIKKVAVLGSGVMGSRIACHFAGVGVNVILLDIAPKELNEEEKAKGLTLEDKAVKNRIVNNALQSAVKSKPSPLYKKAFASRIQTGNFDDDLKKIAEVDWIVEAVIENLEIKKQLFEKVEQFRKEGTIISSNSSGIPMHFMIEGRSADFQQYFCGSHFFNPPRYLRLLEIIPTQKTLPEVTEFLKDYGDLFLGKTIVECKDTPTFIANRIGVYSICSIFHLMKEMDLSVEEVDILTGPVMGRPKSATFRTCDIVGLDTLIKVADGLYKNLPDDEARELFKVPEYVNKLVELNWLGDKSGQGFYKKSKDEKGKRQILALDTKTFEYHPKSKPKFPTLEGLKAVENLKDKLKGYAIGKDKAGEFFRQFHFGLFAYVSNRIPEIADEIYKIDDALKAGFGWELGPFEIWDVLGVEKTVKAMEQAGVKPAQWVYDMLSAGHQSFYKAEEGRKLFFDISSKQYNAIPGTDTFIILDNYRKTNVVWQNSGATLFDIGDGILNLEFHTKMNTMGGEVLEGINKAVDIAEKNYRGLVIGNDAENFSAGANLGMVFMLAIEQEWDEVDFAIRHFQNTMMRLRYSAIPVVGAPHGLSLGGGCELNLHVDQVQAAAETYIGLVEVGAGLIPAGGGTKEFALRASEDYYQGDPEIPRLQQYFMNIAMAKVATSAHEAFDLNILKKGRDKISINRNRLIADAKKAAILLANLGYTQPISENNIKVLGREAIGAFLVGIDQFRRAKQISEHDELIATKLAYVIAGGDLTQPAFVSEQYLLDLEREAFLSLLGTKKTLERIESILKTGKPLRN